MTTRSLYEPPKAPLLASEAERRMPRALEDLFTGRRLLVAALVTMAIGLVVFQSLSYAGSLVFAAPQVYLAVSVLSFASLFVIGPIVAIVGSFRVAKALGISSPLAFALACSAVLPAVNIVVIGWLVFRAGKSLGKSGFKVGVFGSRHT